MPRRGPANKPIRSVAKQGGPQGRQQLRIIGGQWRGRKLSFPEVEGIRPTPDRVRETLFNWLQAIIPGARCLDLFAGSGALGFEALSRGAASVTMVEREARVVAWLVEQGKILAASGLQVQQSDASAFLREAPPSVCDVVFLDPPFHQALVLPCCQELESRGWLGDNSLIYIETEREAVLDGLPERWQEIRQKQAGQVIYRLFRRESQ